MSGITWREMFDITAKTTVLMLTLGVLAGVVLAVGLGTFAGLIWLAGALP